MPVPIIAKMSLVLEGSTSGSGGNQRLQPNAHAHGVKLFINSFNVNIIRLPKLVCTSASDAQLFAANRTFKKTIKYGGISAYHRLAAPKKRLVKRKSFNPQNRRGVSNIDAKAAS